jgi:hypothetical protein
MPSVKLVEKGECDTISKALSPADIDACEKDWLVVRFTNNNEKFVVVGFKAPSKRHGYYAINRANKKLMSMFGSVSLLEKARRIALRHC